MARSLYKQGRREGGGGGGGGGPGGAADHDPRARR